MIPICLCLVAHEPYRLRPYNYFDVGRRHDYWDTEGMRRRLATAERLVYEPATAALARLLDRHREFAFSVAISGPLLDQLAVFAPRLLAAFRSLVSTGRAEPLCATSHHCLSWAVSAGSRSSSCLCGGYPDQHPSSQYSSLTKRLPARPCPF